MPLRKRIDKRHTVIGSRKRAANRYAMICNRIRAETKKNSCYAGVKCRMTLDEFVDWFMPRDYDGCSVDRIDRHGHYEISNIQMIPLKENIAKDKLKSVGGMCVCYSCGENKPIIEFVKDSRRQSGHTTICLACERIRAREKRKRLGS